MHRICSLFSHTAKKPWYHSWMHSCNLWSWKQHRWRNLPAEARVKSRPPRPYELEIVGYRDVGVVLFLIQALLVAQVFGLRSKEQTAMQGAVYSVTNSVCRMGLALLHTLAWFSNKVWVSWCTLINTDVTGISLQCPCASLSISTVDCSCLHVATNLDHHCFHNWMCAFHQICEAPTQYYPNWELLNWSPQRWLLWISIVSSE